MGPPADGPQVRQGDNVAPRCHLTQVRTAVVLGFVVFLACLAGIFSRLPGTLAVIWPANALLLGLLLRNRSSATVCAWLSTAIAYVTADLLTGSQLHVAVLLNAANLLGVLVGFYTVRRIRPDGGVGLDNGANAAWITCLAALSAASGATIGAVAVHTMFDEPLGHAWLGWFAVEFINYAVILPIVLCWPTRSIRAQMAPFHTRNLLVPTALMLVALPLAWFMAGVGSMAFTTPALIAAALSTDVFVTSLFVAAATVWSVVLIVSNGVALTTDAGTPINPSALIGLALLAAGPLATASAMAERRRIDQALRRAMTQDDLTKAYRRGEFVRRAESALVATALIDRPSCLLMMDLDHFKRLNDTFGHPAGDRTLIAFADIVRACAGDAALFARLGGEEFAVLLPGSDCTAAMAVAEAIRARQEDFVSAEFDNATATVSIGLACSSTSAITLTKLMSLADAALYRAKATRRNTVRMTSDHEE